MSAFCWSYAFNDTVFFKFCNVFLNFPVRNSNLGCQFTCCNIRISFYYFNNIFLIIRHLFYDLFYDFFTVLRVLRYLRSINGDAGLTTH